MQCLCTHREGPEHVICSKAVQQDGSKTNETDWSLPFTHVYSPTKTRAMSHE